MRYPIEFLMKHKITFSCDSFCAFTINNTHRGKRINRLWYALKKSNTMQYISIGFQGLGPWPFHLTAVILSFLCLLYELQEKTTERVAYKLHPVGDPSMEYLARRAGDESTHRVESTDITSSHSVDHSLWLRLLWAAKCDQSAFDKACCQFVPQTQKHFTLSQFLPLLR